MKKITTNQVECRITSGSYDYGEYYLGRVHIYERWQPGDSIPATNPIYKRWLYTIRTDIKRTNAEDAQLDAVILARDILDQNNIPYLNN